MFSIFGYILYPIEDGALKVKTPNTFLFISKTYLILDKGLSAYSAADATKQPLNCSSTPCGISRKIPKRALPLPLI